MANSNIVEIQMPDGNMVRVPAWALEETQQEVLKTLQVLAKDDEKLMASNKKLVDNTVKHHKESDNDRNAAKEARDRQLEALRDINETNKKQGLFGSTLLAGTMGALGTVVGFLGAGVLGLVGIGGLLGSAVKNLGDEIRGLNQLGLGLDQPGQMRVDEVIAQMNYLGFSTEKAAEILGDFSGVVNVLGREGFILAQEAFQTATQQGVKLGLSLEQAADVMSEELELRQQLGFLSRINENRAAQQATALYQQQLEAAQILGKSIDDIRKSGQNLIANNEQVQLSIMATAARLGPEMGSKLVNATNLLAGKLNAIGIDENLANQLMNEMFDVQAFISGGGQELFTALSAAGGQEVAQTLKDINMALKNNNPEEAMRLMNQFPGQFAAFGERLSGSAGGLENLKNLMMKLGPLGRSLALSLGNVTEANKRLSKVGGEVNIFAKAATAFDAASSKIKGTFGGVVSDVAGELIDVTSVFVDALTGTAEKQDGLFSVFRDGVMGMRNAVFGILGISSDATSNAESFADVMEKITPKVSEVFNKMTESITNFLRENEIDSVGALVDKVITGLGKLWNALSVVGSEIIHWVDKIQSPAGGIDWGKISLAAAGGIAALFASGAIVSALATGIGSLFTIVLGKIATAGAIAGPLAAGKIAVGAGLTAALPLIAKGTLIVGALTLALTAAGAAVAYLAGEWIDYKKKQIEVNKLQEEAVKSMSNLDDESITAVSISVDKLAKSLSNLYDATDSGVLGLSGPDIDEQVAQVKLFNEIAGLNTDGLINASYGIDVLTASYTRFAKLDSAGLERAAGAIAKINDATDADSNLLERGFQFAKNFLTNEDTGNPPTPREAEQLATQSVEQKPVPQTPMQQPMRRDEVVDLLAAIASNGSLNNKLSKELIRAIQDIA